MSGESGAEACPDSHTSYVPFEAKLSVIAAAFEFDSSP